MSIHLGAPPFLGNFECTFLIGHSKRQALFSHAGWSVGQHAPYEELEHVPEGAGGPAYLGTLNQARKAGSCMQLPLLPRYGYAPPCPSSDIR